jgi:pseudouridine-5'-phosphate glycosidase/pseudouridine kinase
MLINASFRKSEALPQTPTFTPVMPTQKVATPKKEPAGKDDLPAIVVSGSVALDISCDYSPRGGNTHAELSTSGGTTGSSPQLYTSNIAAITPSVGGVGHNVALAAQLAGGGLSVRLCSFVVEDL